MNFDPNIHAELVYDGGDRIAVPSRLGTAAGHQLQGTPLEQLAELAGRVCYDSLGAPNSRNSFEYHAHIRSVRHGSVYEHCAFTVEVRERLGGANVFAPITVETAALAMLNRPGVFVRFVPGALRVTLNLRSAMEFDQWSAPVEDTIYATVRGPLTREGNRLAPRVVDAFEFDDGRLSMEVVEPQTDDEKWISLLMCGSRGMSHELVRHGDWTAISQRSTRYVNEDESPWVEHPLVTQLIRPAIDGQTRKHPAIVQAGNTVHSARETYSVVRETLETAALERGVDKLTARKQARGAARGYLGNALYTELIFSASVAQWRRMLATGSSPRCSDAADAEIRVLFAKALRELQRSRYGDRFADFTLRPAKDGIGEVLV